MFRARHVACSLVCLPPFPRYFSPSLTLLLPSPLLLYAQVAQLELKFRQQSLSLTKMWFFLQPSIRTLEILDNLCTKVYTFASPLLVALLSTPRVIEVGWGSIFAAHR